ncbi:MAG: putative methyltransferase [Enontekio merhavirus]|nr:MAG: putative methyltransferase [Enontekio merhavirus]
MPTHIRNRCVNIDTCWQEPSDLLSHETWEYFERLSKKEGMQIDLILADMQITSPEERSIMLANIFRFVPQILERSGTLILKSYVSEITDKLSGILLGLGRVFNKVVLSDSVISGSFTSEVYLVCTGVDKVNPVSMYPDWRGLLRWVQLSPVFQPIENEFQRAIKLFDQRTTIGVPIQFFPDLEIETPDILKWAGVDASAASKWSRILPRNRDKPADAFIAILCLAGESIYPTGRSVPYNQAMPSDSTVWKLASLQLAIMTWISLSSRRLDMYRKVHSMNQSGVSFQYTISRKRTHEDLVNVKWSWSTKLSWEKNLRIDSGHPGQSRMLRMLSRWSVLRMQGIDWENVDRILIDNRSPSRVRDITERTGLLDLIIGYNPITPLMTTPRLENNDE